MVMPWTAAAVSSALALTDPPAGEDIVFSAVSTDTRQLPEDALFVALVGEHHDAHAFLKAAADAGARGAVVQYVPEEAPASLRYFVVPDTLDALGRLGRFHRRRTGARVCAVTGSNGKTTTKELIRAALSSRHRVHATRGNLNNLVGVPLTLLATPPDADVVIAELGTNAPGEVARLASLVEPDAVVITAISAEHLEGLGDLAGVLREETAVLPWLPARGIAVVPEEPALVERARSLAPTVRVVGFGPDADEAFRAQDVTLDADGRARFTWRGHAVSLRLHGRHNARNALLALALAEAWGVDAASAAGGVATVEAPALRSEIRRIGDLTILADCYNANPGSVLAASRLLVDMPRRGARVAVLGTMLELGPTSDRLHRETAQQIAALPVDIIVATGAFASAFASLAPQADRVIALEDPFAAFDALAPRLHGDELVLLKGSRGVALERLLPRFEELRGVLHPHGETERSRASSTGSGSRGTGLPAEHTPNSSGANGSDETSGHGSA
jgi:UDP-N-acetylmuramoyl-tripeptide--D-alanyl-D-alanine ligase